MIPQEKSLLDQKGNDQEFMEKQSNQKTSRVETIKSHTEVKEDNKTLIIEEWDNEWYPDPSN